MCRGPFLKRIKLKQIYTKHWNFSYISRNSVVYTVNKCRMITETISHVAVSIYIWNNDLSFKKGPHVKIPENRALSRRMELTMNISIYKLSTDASPTSQITVSMHQKNYDLYLRKMSLCKIWLWLYRKLSINNRWRTLL